MLNKFQYIIPTDIFKNEQIYRQNSGYKMAGDITFCFLGNMLVMKRPNLSANWNNGPKCRTDNWITEQTEQSLNLIEV